MEAPAGKVNLQQAMPLLTAVSLDKVLACPKETLRDTQENRAGRAHALPILPGKIKRLKPVWAT